MEIAGWKASSNFDKYLGLPSLVSGFQGAALQGIVDRVKMKLNNWNK